jgi:hypothetical protein
MTNDKAQRTKGVSLKTSMKEILFALTMKMSRADQSYLMVPAFLGSPECGRHGSSTYSPYKQLELFIDVWSLPF